MAIPLKKPKAQTPPSSPVVDSRKAVVTARPIVEPPKAQPAPAPQPAKPVVEKKPQKPAASVRPKPLNPQIPRKSGRHPTLDVPLETMWKLMQQFGHPVYIQTSSRAVPCWAPKVPVKELKEHYKKYEPIANSAVFTDRDEYWCPHCAEVKAFRWLVATDDKRCTGCGVPNYDKAVVKANYGEDA